MSISATTLQALDILVHTPVTQDMLHKIVVATLQVLPCQESTPPASPLAKASKKSDKALPSLMSFLTKLVKYTNIYTGTLMAALVYLNKLKIKLPKNAQGLPCTRHRILLSCLILSSKNHNDSSPKNIHWANYTDGLFSVKDINLMERQLLFLLNWDLKVSNEDMCFHLAKFIQPIKEDLVRSQKMRKYLKKQAEYQKQQQQMIQQQVAAAQQAASQQSLQQHMSHQQAEYALGVPSPTRSSFSSTSSVASERFSRSSSVSSALSFQHGRHASTCSLSPLGSAYFDVEGSPFKAFRQPFDLIVDPRIELTALSEERELNKMLELISRAVAH